MDFSGILYWIRDTALPVVNSIIAVLIPILSPAIKVWFDNRLAGINRNVNAQISGTLSAFSGALSNINENLAQIKTIPVLLTKAVSPVYTQLNAVMDVLVIVANNSRIPDEDKEQVKLVASKVSETEDKFNSYLEEQSKALAESQENIARLTAMVEELKNQLAEKQGVETTTTNTDTKASW